ncbi:cytochrome P450 [Lindgomyces ingoldianus]|uniref:Cytochrome P450 n=1 Tax=Lindgomyces ingoldianus TaxID=673940 RepID=A0ACB6R0T9_9PLEO|nr:cytochrome P450 [Lindgomyces ingoldianus]KAF2472405.1 cytochrome P450 [Lindgomyces ingoldianus]
MAIQKRVLLLAAAAISFFAIRYIPQFTLFESLFWNAVSVYFVLLTLQLIWTVIVYPLCFSPLRHLPSPPNSNFLLGHFSRIFKDPTGEPQRDWIDTVPNDGVLYYRFLFNEPRVLITNPKALAEVLVQRNYEFIKPQRIRESLGRLLGVGILLAEGDEHKRQRRALMPAFSFRHIKDLYPIFWSKSREMTAAIKASLTDDSATSSVVEIREWASRATLDIIGVAGMGQDFGAIENPANELNVTYRTIFAAGRGAQILQLIASQFPQWLFRALPMKRNEEIATAIKTIKKVAADLIRDKRANLEKGGRSDLDILSVAIESGGFSDEDLVNQLMTFLAAGHETTASAMTWAVYLLCKHPEVQIRLREEIRSSLPALNDPDAKISSTDIDHLQYLNAVLNETMRIFPPVPLTLRETVHDTTIQGQFVPKETTVIISPWAINTSKALWGDDAREFNPDRWMGQGRANTGGADSNYAVTTFLHGPRSCIGKDFAKAEFACLMAALVGQFEFELEDPNWKLEIQGGITARPKGGLRVKLTPVEGW